MLYFCLYSVQIFCNFPCDSPLTYVLFGNALFDFQIFVDFPKHASTLKHEEKQMKPKVTQKGNTIKTG